MKAFASRVWMVFKLLRDPTEILAYQVGIETARVKRCHANLDIVAEIGRRRVQAFVEQIQRNDLTDRESNSYLYKVMQRVVDSDVTQEEAVEICIMLLLAAIDTTAGKTGWNVLQLALHPELQEELLAAVAKGGGLTPGIIERSEIPLLAPFIGETHRCTPAVLTDLVKKLSAPADVYGRTLPEGTAILFDSLTVQMDPDLVEDPMTFQPQRWLPEAVEARKGTDKAILDHPFYSGPFSQGSRRCPGSRIAHLEVQVMLAQLLLDWKIEGPANLHWTQVKGSLETVYVPQFPEEIRFVPRIKDRLVPCF